MTEDYWYALTRNVPFGQYVRRDHRPGGGRFEQLSDFRGPKVKGQVTTDVIFRGPTPGDANGPYLSQFLWKPIPFEAAATFTQQYKTSVASDDYMTNFQSWLAVQRGVAAASNVFDSTPRYIRNNRDLAEYLHRDFSYQQYLMTALLLGSFGNPALAPNNYYLSSATQAGGITLGAMFNLDLVARSAIYALRAVYYQKVAGAPADPAGGVCRTHSRPPDRTRTISDSCGRSEFGGAAGGFQVHRIVSSADALSGRVARASVLSGTARGRRGACVDPQGAV